MIRGLLISIGILAMGMGLLWVGQGTGAVMWPQSSFMLAESRWAIYGAVLALLGLALVWSGTRRKS